MPDITILPLLADYFKVSTDQLLGLKPLDGETYIPEKTATKEFWNQKLEYLLRTRKSYWNDDYTRFFISQVWKIDKLISVLDCGCGYGFLGLLLLPYRPEGSTYTGIDFAEDLIKKGKALFESQKLEADFLCESVFNSGCRIYVCERKYDFLFQEFLWFAKRNYQQ
ncbi:MAG: methyltransferase domain-containing protein [Lachnospiraceae bacterium]